MWEIYDALLENIRPAGNVTVTASGGRWSYVGTDTGASGVAMTMFFDAREPLYPDGIIGLPAVHAARAVKSWNFEEAALGMAAINASCNTLEHIAELGCSEPYDNYCTRGLSFKGKRVALIGHLRMPEETLRDAREVCILEQHPQPGDYPDSACEYILPNCDIALITGSSLVNKTLPRLLQLCEKAYTILTGPTVPLCSALLDLGVDRLAGMAVTDGEGAKNHAALNADGPPFRYGKTFLLTGKRG